MLLQQNYAERIHSAAIHHGYDNCGIIPISDMDGYGGRIQERIASVPESENFYNRLLKDSEIAEKFPWAKSIIICTRWYGNYRIPESLKRHYGKAYLTDGRVDKQSEAWLERQKFEKALEALGVRYALGAPGMRYAAFKAGIGIIRKNNFLYTRRGSYVALDSWMIDKDVVLKRPCEIRPCEDSCDLCQKACKTCSLSAPYTMNPLHCVSFITTFGGGLTPKGIEENDLGYWVYGCDDCQDICPHNKKTWTDDREFPGLKELEGHLTPQNLAVADDGVLEEKIQPKLWYIPKDRLEQYRENAKRALRKQEKEHKENDSAAQGQ